MPQAPLFLLRQVQPSVTRLSASNSAVYFPTASVGGDNKRKGSGCKGRNVKEEELLKFGDVARLVVKEDGIEVL